MKTLTELKAKFKDVDWKFGEYSVHTTQLGKTYLLHAFDTQIWVYDIQVDSLSVIQTYTNKTVEQVKETLG